MNILVYNLAAEYGGALSVLESFYEEVLKVSDDNTHWYFVISNPDLKSTKNITILNYPEVKKSWLHRWFFDNFKAPNLIKKYDIHKVYSMQNMSIKKCSVEQIVYMHQPLQFSPVKYSFFKKEERIFAFRQHIICNLIRKSLRNADKIIVQTKWIENETRKWVNSHNQSYFVVPPKIELNFNIECNPVITNENLFFYPSGDGLHKNHDLIVEACLLLKKEKINDYKIIFTLDKSQSEYTKRIYRIVEDNNLNIEFVGYLTREETFRYYRKSVLLFPSYLETYGLPLLEGKICNNIIFSSDLPYAHEVLGNYNNAYYFNYNDPLKLKELIMKKISNEIKKEDIQIIKNQQKNNLSVIDIILS